MLGVILDSYFKIARTAAGFVSIEAGMRACGKNYQKLGKLVVELSNELQEIPIDRSGTLTWN